jgi:predicted small integral membrane protein
MSLKWMAWTTPTATFFIIIFIMLICMTIWEILSPTIERRGFLPMSTTRGDRLFIGLLGSAYIHLAWLLITDLNIWNAVVISIIYMITVMKYG